MVQKAPVEVPHDCLDTVINFIFLHETFSGPVQVLNMKFVEDSTHIRKTDSNMNFTNVRVNKLIGWKAQCFNCMLHVPRNYIEGIRRGIKRHVPSADNFFI